MACALSEDSDPPSLIKVFAVRLKKRGAIGFPVSTQRRLIRLGAQTDLNLRWAHSSGWFCRAAAQFSDNSHTGIYWIYFNNFHLTLLISIKSKFLMSLWCITFITITIVLQWGGQTLISSAAMTLLEIVDKYVCLAILLTERLEFEMSLLISKCKLTGGLPYNVYTKLYDSVVSPVINYYSSNVGREHSRR